MKNTRNKPLNFYHLRTNSCQSSLLELILFNGVARRAVPWWWRAGGAFPAPPPFTAVPSDPQVFVGS